MQGYNLIMVFSPDRRRILMCHRRKDPYKGLFNLVGGKIEPEENGLEAAYRELFEETGISDSQIKLRHMMDFRYYHKESCYVEVYVGRLPEMVEVFGEENDLLWQDLDRDFFSMEHYAGEGNIGHMIEQVRLYPEQYLD